MPHVIVKMWPGKSDADKTRLAEAITEAFIASLGSNPDTLSIGIEDVAKEDWDEQVYQADIAGKEATLFKRTPSL